MIKEIEFELCILYLSLNKANKTLTTKNYTNMHFIQETNVEVCIFIFHKLFTRENANIVIYFQTLSFISEQKVVP